MEQITEKINDLFVSWGFDSSEVGPIMTLVLIIGTDTGTGTDTLETITETDIGADTDADTGTVFVSQRHFGTRRR